MASIKILIVEDEPIIALDLKRRLTRLSFEIVAIADCAEAALLMVAQLQPELVLMDIQLQTEIDGIQAAAQIRSEFNLPVIFVTAHADAMSLQQARTVSPFGYVVKPFDNTDLITAIEIALGRYQAESAIQNSLAQERQLHELKSQFVSVVSHEFRTPLTVIRVALDLLERAGDNLPPEIQQSYFRRAKLSIKQMNQLLEEVLVAGESDLGKLQCQPNSLDLFQFCNELVEECSAIATANHLIQFEPTGDVEAARYASIDEKLLRCILTNLLSNAIKYSPKGGTIFFTLTAHPCQVTFRIQDPGIGIPRADQENLFTTFYRATNVAKIRGTGLGLSIVKRCVEIHGGKINLESEVGIGSIFTVTLPMQPQ